MFFSFIIFYIVRINTISADCATSKVNEQREQIYSNSNLSLFSTFFSRDVYYSSVVAVNSHIEVIPPYAFANYCIEALDISNNEIIEITRTSFAGIYILKQLRLDRNQLESIDGLLDTDDDGLQSLNGLHLSINKIKLLTKSFPTTFLNLFVLDLSHNLIEVISPNVFYNLTNLFYLHLSSNHIRRLTSFMFNGLSNVVFFELHENQIEEIENNSFHGLTKLSLLVLQKNNLVYLNETTFIGLTALESLLLNSNKLVGFHPRAFVGLNYLSLIDFSKNFNLTEPLIIEKILNLDMLYLEQITIRTIKANHFFGFEVVINLFLDRAKIEKIENGAFENMKNIKQLYLDNNQITTLNSLVFKGLSNLEVISLNENVISSIHPDVFQSFPKVNSIYLEKNLLKSIPSGLFSNLSFLIEINLHSNQIIILESASFTNMSSLLEIYLSDNEIVTIKPRVFQYLPCLQTLDLSFNKLLLIRNFFFSGLKSLKSLILKGNGINSIESLSFVDLINIKTINLEDNFIFSIDSNSFEILQGKSIVEININQNQIDEIEAEMFSGSKIKSLSFQKNNLKSLTSESLRHLVETQEFDFSLNKIEFIANDLFGNGVTSKAKTLLLSSNNIANLKFLAGDQFSLLKSLDLSFNCLETLEVAYFESFVNLTELNVSNNPILKIESGFFKQLSLKTLYMKNLSNEIQIDSMGLNELDLSNSKNVRINFTKYSSLKKLVLKNTNIALSSVPFVELSSVNYLDLSENQDDGNFTLDGLKPAYLYLNQMKITSIKRFRFNEFENLIELYLAFNEISLIENDDLPVELYILDLSNNRIVNINYFNIIIQKILNLKNNIIKTFWTDEKFLHSIKELILSNNILEDFIPNQIGISNFQLGFITLDLSKNSLEKKTLTTISFLLPEYNILQKLYVNDNKITDLSDDCFNKMDLLQEINLASNLISRIDWSSFLNMDLLEWLNLGNNSISVLDERTFSNLVQLKYLNLSHNNMEYIGSLLFAQLFAIQTLDLSSNRLKLIGDYSFNQLNLLENLYLEANSLELAFQEHLFEGLDSIVNLFVSMQTLSNDYNSKCLLASLRAQLIKHVDDVTYFRAINIIHEDVDSFDKSTCLLVINFLKNKIQINLRSDSEMILYLANCQSILYYE